MTNRLYFEDSYCFGHDAVVQCAVGNAFILDRTCMYHTGGGQPPVENGHVRVVEIKGFEAQAFGGTHVRKTKKVGRPAVVRIDNKGRINRRFHVLLPPTTSI